jgi:hypothetical protein
VSKLDGPQPRHVNPVDGSNPRWPRRSLAVWPDSRSASSKLLIDGLNATVASYADNGRLRDVGARRGVDRWGDPPLLTI